jgi:DisA bacterial checkpoint controller nucleotide-binding
MKRFVHLRAVGHGLCPSSGYSSSPVFLRVAWWGRLSFVPDPEHIPPGVKESLEFLRRLVNRVLVQLPFNSAPEVALAYLLASWSDDDMTSGLQATPGFRWKPDRSSWPADASLRRAALREHAKENPISALFSLTGFETTGFEQMINDLATTASARDQTRRFFSRGIQVGSYHFVALVEFDLGSLTSLPTETRSSGSGTGETTVSLFEAALTACLSRFRGELSKGLQEPRFIARRDVESVLHEAGSIVMSSVQRIASRKFVLGGDLFLHLDRISKLRHERAESRGRIIFLEEARLAKPGSVRFRTPIPLHDTAWVRKLLETARSPLCLASPGETIMALLNPSSLAAFTYFSVDFQAQHRWTLRASIPLMHVVSGLPSLPTYSLQYEDFAKAFERLFLRRRRRLKPVWSTVRAILAGDHGAIVVVCRDAKAEASRLSGQGTCIDPKVLSASQARAAASVDGALILDLAGRCHAIGVVLDGRATEAGTPARGARFNSALRYVSPRSECLAVVRSEDGAVDLLPRLRPQVRRSELHTALADIRGSKGVEPTARLREQARLLAIYSDEVEIREDDISLLMSAERDGWPVFDDPAAPRVLDPHITDFLPEGE